MTKQSRTCNKASRMSAASITERSSFSFTRHAFKSSVDKSAPTEQKSVKLLQPIRFHPHIYVEIVER
jgi:hypothetical protein